MFYATIDPHELSFLRSRELVLSVTFEETIAESAYNVPCPFED